MKRKAGSGRPAKITEEVKRDIKDRARSPEAAPRTHQSQRQIATSVGVSQSSVRRVLSEDFWAAKKVEVHRLDADHCKQRVERCRKLLERFPYVQSSDDIVFIDEKVFELEHQPNKQNDRLYVPHEIKKSEVPAEK